MQENFGLIFRTLIMSAAAKRIAGCQCSKLGSQGEAVYGSHHPDSEESQGQMSAQGKFAPPEPEFRAEFWETNFGRPKFGPKFLGSNFLTLFFPAKEAP